MGTKGPWAKGPLLEDTIGRTDHGEKQMTTFGTINNVRISKSHMEVRNMHSEQMAIRSATL